MRRKLALITVVPILLAVGAATGLATQQKPPCSASNSATIYQDTKVRVYERYIDTYTARTSACLFATNERRVLGESSFRSQFQVVRLKVAAPWIAYLYNEWTDVSSQPDQWICAISLRTHARNCPGRVARFHGFGVTHQGSLAWLDEDVVDGGGCCYVFERRPAGPQGPTTPLDSGAHIDPTSFAIGGTHVYWTKAGAPKSATMP